VKNDTIHIQISDTGIGIPPEKIDGLFEPSFTKGGSRVKAKLGLFTCYNIVQKHRGHITVDSEVGKGTTVTISFPVDLERLIDVS
jgi:signal transduction histidine kinase